MLIHHHHYIIITSSSLHHQEVLANNDPVALNLFYNQAVEDVSKGKIPSGDHLTQLRLLKAQGKKEQVRAGTVSILLGQRESL